LAKTVACTGLADDNRVTDVTFTLAGAKILSVRPLPVTSTILSSNRPT
jgi:hypothetical protein